MFEDEYESYDEIPSKVRHLFVESGEKWVLIGSGDIKTTEDVNRLQDSLRKERDEHKKTKRKYASLSDYDPEDIIKKLDSYDELEAAANGKLDDDKINQLVESRVKTKISPLERQLKTFETELSEKESELNTYRQKDRARLITDEIRKACIASKVRSTAIDDVILYGLQLFEPDESGNVVAKEGVGVTPGLRPDVWLSDMQDKRPHWWPDSFGAGATGNNGRGGVKSNPFTAEAWNVTEQGRLVRENPEKAQQLARAAGTTVGGGKPAKK